VLAFLVLGALGVWLIDIGLALTNESWPEWTFVGACTVIVSWAFVEAQRARRRLVVLPFDDFARGADEKGHAKGLATLVLAELEQLRSAFRQVDHSRCGPPRSDSRNLRVETGLGAGRSWVLVDNPAISILENPDMALAETLSLEGDVKVGNLFEVPLSALSRLIERLVRGRTLYGSVLRDAAGKLVLTGQLRGVATGKTWRVDEEDATRDWEELVRSQDELSRPVVSTRVDTAERADDHVRPLPPRVVLEEYVCRLYVALRLGGTTRWRALRCFWHGCRQYRRALRLDSGGIKPLRRASQWFEEAAKRDVAFSDAFYNLGVVKQELRDHDGAEDAFEKAIEAEPLRWEPHLALAQLRLQQVGVAAAAKGGTAHVFILKQSRRAHDLADADTSRRRRRLPRDRIAAAIARARASRIEALALLSLGEDERGLKKSKAAVCEARRALVSCERLASDDEEASRLGRKEARLTAAANLRGLALVEYSQRARRANEQAGRTPGEYEGKPNGLPAAHGPQRLKPWEQRYVLGLIKRAISLTPNDDGLRADLADLYLKCNNARQAEYHYREALEIEPSKPRYWAGLAKARSQRDGPGRERGTRDAIVHALCAPWKRSVADLSEADEVFNELRRAAENINDGLGVKALDVMWKDIKTLFDLDAEALRRLRSATPQAGTNPPVERDGEHVGVDVWRRARVEEWLGEDEAEDPATGTDQDPVNPGAHRKISRAARKRLAEAAKQEDLLNGAEVGDSIEKRLGRLREGGSW
jgi:tetratricopeptide (TPR) repeat protein